MYGLLDDGENPYNQHPHEEAQASERQGPSRASEAQPTDSADQVEETNSQAQEPITPWASPQIVTVIGSSIAAITLFVIGWQARETRRAALAAEASAEATKRIVALTDRPWIKVEPRVTDQGLEFSDDASGGAWIDLVIDLNNVGKSVAQHVDVKCAIMAVPFTVGGIDPNTHSSTIWRRFMKWAGAQPISPAGFSIFPGETAPFPQRLIIDGSEIADYWSQHRPQFLNLRRQNRDVEFLIVGSVLYKRPSDDETVRSEFAVEVWDRNTGNLRLPRAANAPLRNVVLTPSSLGLRHAE